MERTIAFDTHAYVKKLKAVGFTEDQAEAQAEAIAELVEERLVTKQYLDLRLAELKSGIIKWVAGMLVAQAAVVATLVRLL